MTGGAHFHVFRNDDTGEEVIERTTAAKHRLMKLSGGAKHNPVKPGHTWLMTFGMHEYNTPDGCLGENQYAEDDEFCYVRVADSQASEVYTLEKDMIVDGRIKEEDVEIVKAKVREFKYGNRIR